MGGDRGVEDSGQGGGRMGPGPPLAPGGRETSTGHNVQKCLPGQAKWGVLVLPSSWAGGPAIFHDMPDPSGPRT